MADPLAILKQIGNMVGMIRKTVKTVGDNNKNCLAILELLDDVNTVMDQLQLQTPDIRQNKAMIRTVERVERGLQRASDQVAAWQKKGFVRHAIEAADTANELDKVYRDMLMNLVLANLASNSNTNSPLARLPVVDKHEALPQLQAPRPSSSASQLLDIYPLQLPFRLERNKEAIMCPVTLTNWTDDHYFGVFISPTNNKFTCPRRTIVAPRSTMVVQVTMKMHEQPPQEMGKFYVLMFVTQSRDDLAGFLNENSDLAAQVEKLQIEVHSKELTAITCEPASCCQIITRSTEDITCTDVHPNKTWLVTGHWRGHVSIWDYYQQKETAMKWQITTRHRVCSTKFIAQERWLAVGDDNGYIYVYHYTADAKLYERTRFRAYSNGDSVDLLAVHPIQPFLLSSSKFHRKIMLWDWTDGWNKVREFNVKTDEGVRSLKFNPGATGSFPCVTFANGVQVWQSIRSPTPIITLEGTFRAHHFALNNQFYLATLHSPRGWSANVPRTAPNSQIWDLKTREVVHTLGVAGHQIRDVACHPTLPVLATALDDGTVCLWDTRTWRLEKMVHITNCLPGALRFCGDMNGLRLYIRFNSIIAILEVNLTTASTSQRTGGRN